MKKIWNISLHELAVQENMSARAIGACTQMGLDTIEKIHYFNKKHGDFYDCVMLVAKPMLN